MKLKLALLVTLASSQVYAAPCTVPGELMHWQADYCMGRSETDDFASPSVQRCMDKEGKRQFSDVCVAKTEYKQKLCSAAVANGFESSLRACMKDRKFSGPTVRNGGVS